MKGEIKQTNGDRGRLRRRILNRLVCSVLASLGIFGGISSLVAGCLSVVLHGIIPGDTLFGDAGTALLVLGIPLLLLGSVLLDELEPHIKGGPGLH